MKATVPLLASLAVVSALAATIACRSATASPTDIVAAANAPVAPAGTHVGTSPGHAGAGTALTPQPGHALAAFSEGCFWGSEDTFRHVGGVTATAVGYTGGHTTTPTYEDVCSHTTGHAETVLIEFDPQRVTYAQFLQVFWNSHDPTTVDRQGPDFGDQYRSAIWTFSPEEAETARKSMQDEQKRTQGAIVTQVQPMGRFWIAEGYHQQYDEKTGRHSCPLPRHGTSS